MVAAGNGVTPARALRRATLAMASAAATIAGVGSNAKTAPSGPAEDRMISRCSLTAGNGGDAGTLAIVSPVCSVEGVARGVTGDAGWISRLGRSDTSGAT